MARVRVVGGQRICPVCTPPRPRARGIGALWVAAVGFALLGLASYVNLHGQLILTRAEAGTGVLQMFGFWLLAIACMTAAISLSRR